MVSQSLDEFAAVMQMEGAAVKGLAVASVVVVADVVGVSLPIIIIVIIAAIIIREAFINLLVAIEGIAVGFIIIIKDPR